MSIFDAIAIEAAAKAIYAFAREGYEPPVIPWDKHLQGVRDLHLDATTVGLAAATASLRERGKLTAQVPSGADCHPESPHASTFIIRLGEKL